MESRFDIGDKVWFSDEGKPMNAQIEAIDFACGIGVVYLLKVDCEQSVAFCVRPERELFKTKQELFSHEDRN